MTYHVKCKHCGKEFETRFKDGAFCSAECRRQYFVHKKTVENSEKLKREGIEGKDYVIDRWNGLAVKRMYGSYFRRVHPDKTLDDYRREFPDAKLYSEVDDANVGKSRGLHMKEEKYKKMFSEKFRGENNPMSKSKTTEEFRKSCSPFSSKFYEVRGMDEDDRKEFIKSVNDNREKSTFNTKIEYYVDKGYTEQEARVLRRKRQDTRSLNFCIKKYGKEYGEEIYKTRNSKWSEKMEQMAKDGVFSRVPKEFKVFSKKELLFINDILSATGLDSSKCKYYKEHTSDQLMLVDEGNHYLYDFVYEDKIIEFNGTYWHADPRFYNLASSPIGKKTAGYVWERDARKASVAAKNGYRILYVWEADYESNKTEVINRCIQFLTT